GRATISPLGTPMLLALPRRCGREGTVYGRPQQRPSAPARSRDEIAHHPAVDVGQSVFAALKPISQPLVVQAEQVQDGRVQVVDVDGILRHCEAELVRATVGMAALD